MFYSLEALTEKPSCCCLSLGVGVAARCPGVRDSFLSSAEVFASSDLSTGVSRCGQHGLQSAQRPDSDIRWVMRICICSVDDVCVCVHLQTGVVACRGGFEGHRRHWLRFGTKQWAWTLMNAAG